MNKNKRQSVRLGIQYYIGQGWAIVIQAPKISEKDIIRIQLVVHNYLAENKLTGVSNPYAASSSPYTHEVLVYHLNNPPSDIMVFLNTLYPKILAEGFRNPES